MRIAIGLFLVAHGLIHLSYLSPAPSPAAGGPAWPFDMARSWLVTNLGMDPGLIRLPGTLLVLSVAIAFGLAGLAALGVVVPEDWWRVLVIAGAVLSVITLALFFHAWIALGVVIDALLLYLVAIQGWEPFGVGAGGG